MTSPAAASDSRVRTFRLHGSTLVTGALVAVCLVIFVWPIVMIVLGAFVDGQPGARVGWTVQPFLDVYTSAETFDVVRNSIVLAAAVTIPGKFLAFYFAWLVARTDTPLRRLITPTMLAVLGIPMLFYGISWSLLGNENVGLLNDIIQSITGTDATPVNVESFAGLVFVSILKSTAFGYFILIGPMYAMSRAMEEAANISGARRLRTFFGINMPVMAPALLSALVLGFILGLEYFELPLLLAAPAGIDILSTQIFNYLNDFTPPGYAQASALSLCILAILLLLLVAQQRIVRKRNFETLGGKNVNTQPWKLGRWRYVGTGAFLVYAAFALALPLIELVRTSLLPYLGATGGYSTDNYSKILDNPGTATAIRNTALLAVLGGLCVMVLALGIVYVVRRAKPAWIGRLISRSTWLPWSTPGTALALGILWIVLSVGFVKQFYGGLAIMLVGLVIVATPLAMRSVDSAIGQVGAELEEAAWLSGASRLRAYGAIVVRLILPSFFAGWLLTGILISGNVVMPLMLGSTTLKTVPKLTYDLYSTGLAPQSAAFACLILGGLLGVYLIGMLARWALHRLLAARSPVVPLPMPVTVAAGIEPSPEMLNREAAAVSAGQVQSVGGR